MLKIVVCCCGWVTRKCSHVNGKSRVPQLALKAAVANNVIKFLLGTVSTVFFRFYMNIKFKNMMCHDWQTTDSGQMFSLTVYPAAHSITSCQILAHLNKNTLQHRGLDFNLDLLRGTIKRERKQTHLCCYISDYFLFHLFLIKIWWKTGLMFQLKYHFICQVEITFSVRQALLSGCKEARSHS